MRNCLVIRRGVGLYRNSWILIFYLHSEENTSSVTYHYAVLSTILLFPTSTYCNFFSTLQLMNSFQGLGTRFSIFTKNRQLVHDAQSFLRTWQWPSQARNPKNFKEPKVLLRRTQPSVTGPYP
jgi:hypothetical protein